ncbi:MULTISPECIES: hypothetical protein [unclassified Pseudomonas]|uniref:hypothetical protein n=1 Tax=unclassified Pseudomonas TaxID=196821 RepID=UPI00288CD420|nr:hypothetical protein [Pseudomonas sp. rhizo66]MDT3313270.1 hypothetical protein [Pseudomonas sp. rhizo66]
MYLTGRGRKPFLEFLRNLTPQALMLSISFVAFLKVREFGVQFDNPTFARIFTGVFCFAMFVVAAYANASCFLEDAFKVEEVRKVEKLSLKNQFKSVIEKISRAWRTSRFLFVEIVLMTLVVEFGLVAVLYMSVVSALKMSGS